MAKDPSESARVAAILEVLLSVTLLLVEITNPLSNKLVFDDTNKPRRARSAFYTSVCPGTHMPSSRLHNAQATT